jgi:acyl dehydratase
LEGTEIRGRFKLIDKRIDAKAREIATFDSVIEIKGEARPALVAKWLAVWVPATTR